MKDFSSKPNEIFSDNKSLAMCVTEAVEVVSVQQGKRKRNTDEELSDIEQNVTPISERWLGGPHKRKELRIEIPASLNLGQSAVQDSSNHSEDECSPTSLFSALSNTSLDSLFDAPSAGPSSTTTASSSASSSHRDRDAASTIPASLTAPEIPGLFFNAALLLPPEVADSVFEYCLNTYFRSSGANQVMLFGRLLPALPSSPTPPSPSAATSTSGLPPILLSLLSTLSSLIRPTLTEKVHDLLFPAVPTRARQAIINLYQPGEGITPHVDLLGRYGDGIVGVSLGSGCVMRFDKVPPSEGAEPDEDHGPELGVEKKPKKEQRHDLYLPERSVMVLSEDARYEWTHGIEKRKEDYVYLPSPHIADASDSKPTLAGQWIERGVRLSITFRWLLPGADVVGEPEDVDGS